MKLIINILLLTLFLSHSLQAHNLEKVSLQLNWKYQFEFAGFIAAKEKGFYKDIGLDVDIIEFQNDIDVVDDVLTKKVQYGTYNSSILTKDKTDIEQMLNESFN